MSIFKVTATTHDLLNHFNSREQWELYSTMEGWEQVADGINDDMIEALESGLVLRVDEAKLEDDDSDALFNAIYDRLAMFLCTDERRKFGAGDTEGRNNLHSVLTRMINNFELTIRRV